MAKYNINTMKQVSLCIKKQLISWYHLIRPCVCAQWCPTLCDPVEYSPLGFLVRGIIQARILEWVAISFSRGSSWPGRDRTRFSCISCIAGGWIQKSEFTIFICRFASCFFFFPLGFGNFILTLVMSNCILWSDGQCMKNFVLFYKSNIVVVLLVLFFHRRFSVLSSS